VEIRNQKDFGAGLMYMVVGIFFAYLASQYQMGTPAKMGPATFPSGSACFWPQLACSF